MQYHTFNGSDNKKDRDYYNKILPIALFCGILNNNKGSKNYGRLEELAKSV